METREQVVEFIKDVKFAYLATLGTDNVPRVRPLAANTVYGDAVYFFTFRPTRKVAELAAHPQAELVWARMADNAQVRMRGKVTLEEDAEVQARFKADNPMVAQLLPPGAEALFALFKIEPDVVEAVVGLKPYTQVAW
ncbi:MAG: pyridoxamine 5'-phosphate oxidase family protein [Anaerolineae bacterium]|nr:pyridoxamine 5'-phosphate oxidase family protein [Anaerolineae bacterium]